MANRIRSLKDSFGKKEIEGFVVAIKSNILYLTEAIGVALFWAPLEGENIAFVYDCNYELVKTIAINCRVELVKRNEDPFKKIADYVRSLRLRNIAFDNMNAPSYMKMRKVLSDTRIRPWNKLIRELRSVKDSNEIKNIEKAAELTDEGLKAAVSRIEPGIREYEIASRMECVMRELGSEGVAFDTQVASGERSAFPHGGCTDRKIRRGEPIVIDFGAKYNNYRADMTRTISIGNTATKQMRIYETVLEAHQEAFEEMNSGVNACEVDAVARKVIEKAGFGDRFVHGLGHGVGLDIHEAPLLNPDSNEIIKFGNVVTDEPGIYISGYCGVRIEDTILVENHKARRLTKSDYKLII